MSDKKGKKSNDIFSQFQEDHRPTSEQLAIYFPSALALTLIPLCTYSLELFFSVPLYHYTSITSFACQFVRFIHNCDSICW